MFSQISRVFTAQSRLGFVQGRSRFATAAAAESSGFKDTVEFIHSPTSELRWAISRAGVHCKQDAVRNPSASDLKAAASSLPALKEMSADQTLRFTVNPHANSVEMDEETFEEVVADAQKVIGNSDKIYVLDKGLGSLFGIGTRVITEDPRMALALSSILITFPKRAVLDFEHALTVYASPQVDELSGGLAVSASNSSRVVVRGPHSLAHVRDTIAGAAAANFISNGKLVLGCNAYDDGSSVRLVCGEEKAAKGAVASGHVVWGPEGVVTLWNEESADRNLYETVSEIKLIAEGAKKSKKGSSVSAEEAGELISQFLPSGGSDAEKEAFVSLASATKITVVK